MLFLFRVATEESTEAPNEESTRVPPGKTTKNPGEGGGIHFKIESMSC